MHPPKLIFLFVAIIRRRSLLLALCLAPLLAAAPRFAHEASDLKPDPAAKFGVLENGLRYVIYPNHEPKGRASLRLLVLAGSLHEEENQRGVAHFLEHMAFNGSDHFAPGTLIEFFQRMGMSFGGDTNASTGFDRTQYMLELPDTKEPTLAEGLRVLADDAGGLLLRADEIDKERGIILSEKRARDSVGYRTQVAQFEFMFGTTRLPTRMPIGLAEIIEKAPRERFVDFWNTWYRPEKLAVIVVGEVEVAAVEKQIAAAFAALRGRAPAKPEPALGTVAKFDGVRAGHHAEAEAPSTRVSLVCVTPYVAEPDTAANRVKRLPRRLAVGILNRRLAELAKKENAPFLQAAVSVSENFKFMGDATVDLTCKAERWQAALAAGEQELRRAIEHGFQPDELKEVVATTLSALEQSVKSAATRRSSALANGLLGSLVAEEVFTAPADNLARLKPALEKVTPEECVAALRDAFGGNGLYVSVTGTAKIPGDAVAAINTAYEESRVVAVLPKAAEEARAWAYTDFGAPGKVTKREHIADLDVTLVTFANGVRLNLKRTDFDAGRIMVSARLGNGSMSEPADQRGLAQIASSVFNGGGLGKHSVDDLRRILAGRNAGAAFQTTTDAFVLAYPTVSAARGGRGSGAGGTTREDLLLTLQLFAAHLTDPGYRPEGLRQSRSMLDLIYGTIERTPSGPIAMEVANLIASGNPRFGLPPKDVVMARTLDEVRAWLSPELARREIEVAIVGDLDVDATIDAVAQTLGALPPREPKLALAELRQVAFPTTPFTKSYTIASQIPKGIVALYWPTTDGLEAKRARRLSLLASIYGDRLRVKLREEMGGTYSPRAQSNASDTFPGYGYLMTAIDIDPAAADKIAEAAIALADDLAKNGVTEEELNRARLPALTAAKDSSRSNAYWLGNVLARAQEKPEVLGWAHTRIADLEAITAAELSALAKSYLGRDRVSRATVVPGK
ncbi:MAG: insulinase family protein [Opitutus sp.]|nr:insulinase family protein [Opitutus sp.]